LGRFFGQNLVQLPQDILHPKNITQFRTDLAEFCGNPKTPGEFTRLLLDSLSQRPELADLLCLQDSIVPDTPRSVEGSSDLDGEVVATVRRRKEAPTARSLFNPFGSSRRPESVVPMTSMPDEHAFSA
jgi:hypothetical protein